MKSMLMMESQYDLKSGFQNKLASIEALFAFQPEHIKYHFLQKGNQIVEDLVDGLNWILFYFPEYVCLHNNNAEEEKVWIPPRYRKQQINHRFLRHFKVDMVYLLLRRLEELQESANPGLVLCAQLLRYQIAMKLLSVVDNRDVIQRFNHNNSTISLSEFSPYPAMLRTSFSNQNNEIGKPSSGTVNHQVDQGINDEQKATLDEEKIVEMIFETEMVLHILEMAFVFEPAIIENQIFRNQYSATIVQLKNQCQTYVRNEVLKIIATIRLRALNNSLNRGLSLSIPYFDDQALQLCNFDYQVIPAGRILFEPVFVVDATAMAKEQVENDKSLSQWTKEHLLAELDLIQKSFALERRFTPIGMYLQNSELVLDDNRGVRHKTIR